MARAKLGRRQPSLTQEPKVLIICEDSKSSLVYLGSVKFHYRISDNVAIEHCGKTDPDGIVNYGVSKKNKFEKVFCVIDRDTHENFDQAINRAKDNKIDLIISYPCFEYWLLLHFVYSRKPYMVQSGKSPAENLIADLRKVAPEMSDYDKGTSKDYFDLLYEKLPLAIKHAARAVTDADADGEENPSTYLHKLIQKFSANKFV